MTIKNINWGNYKEIIVYIEFSYNLHNYLQFTEKNNEAVYLKYLPNWKLQLWRGYIHMLKIPIWAASATGLAVS